MWSDYLCIEHCRGCGKLVVPSACGAVCACPECWAEHAETETHVEPCDYADAALPVASGTTYSGVLKKMLYCLKYYKDKPVVSDLGALTLKAFDKLSADGCFPSQPLLVPVPLHWMRLLMRGYNQAEMLAEYVAKCRGLKVDLKLLSRRRCTKAQHGLGREQRQINIAGAFRANRFADSNAPPIILVDDLYTSGATIREAATILAARGFHCVAAITAARAALDSPRAGINLTVREPNDIMR